MFNHAEGECLYAEMSFVPFLASLPHGINGASLPKISADQRFLFRQQHILWEKTSPSTDNFSQWDLYLESSHCMCASFPFMSFSWATSWSTLTYLPNSQERRVREAARPPSALCWMKSYQPEADGSQTVVYLAIRRETRYCSFNPKREKLNQNKPQTTISCELQ